MRAVRVMETCLYAEDLAAAEGFYARVLGMEPHSREEGQPAFLRCGAAMILLFRAQETQKPGGDVPAHGARGPGHVAFGVPGAALAGWKDRLEREGVRIEDEVAWPQGGRSLYFRDPAGNSVELTTPRTWGLPDA